MMARKGIVTQILNQWHGRPAKIGIIDWCNADGVFDWFEDIEPSFIDMHEFPELKEGSVVTVERMPDRSLKLISVEE
jgi:hypothetical protein